MEKMILGRIIDFATKGDENGLLIAVEAGREIPFEIRRVFYIFDTDENVERGFHAHKKLKQVLICLTGACNLQLDDGINQESIRLEDNKKGIFLPPHIWHEMKNFEKGTVLISLASEIYDEADYLRNYNDFLSYWKGRVE
jgi:dTDP-4-dehydrorhamnose 3,5-epimerase-like enzyme